jgi:hypothetical protein
MTPAVTKRRNSSLQSHGLLHQLATIAAAPEERYLPFPLTDIQQAYWLGRQEGVELGGVTTHRYCEIECEGLGPERLSSAKSVQRDGCLSLVGGARREGDRAGGEFFELDGHSLLASRVVSPLRSRSESRLLCVPFLTIRRLPRWVAFLPTIERAGAIAQSPATFFERKPYCENLSSALSDATGRRLATGGKRTR